MERVFLQSEECNLQKGTLYKRDETPKQRIYKAVEANF